jgi:hypothetical protein
MNLSKIISFYNWSGNIYWFKIIFIFRYILYFHSLNFTWWFFFHWSFSRIKTLRLLLSFFTIGKSWFFMCCTSILSNLFRILVITMITYILTIHITLQFIINSFWCWTRAILNLFKLSTIIFLEFFR